MKTTLGLKDFRIFDEKGASVHINPLTVLTGCNSSGKSSIVKALILLNEFLKGVRESTPGAEPRLKFDRKPLSLLGNFESIVNKDAHDKRITLSYTVDSLYLGGGTAIELTFGIQDNDIRKDGFLKEVAIKDADGNLLYHETGYRGIRKFFPANNPPLLPGVEAFLESKSFNADSIPVASVKARFFAYHLIVDKLRHYDGARSDNELSGKPTDKEVEKMEEDVIGFLRKMGKQNDVDLVLHAADCFSRKRLSDDLRKMFKSDSSIVERAMQSDIITYLPVLDTLDTISKDDFEIKFKAMCTVEESNQDGLSKEYIEGLVNRIVSEFTRGDYRVFSDYYRSVENKFLAKGSMMVNSFGGLNEKLAIPDWELHKQLSISDAYPLTEVDSGDHTNALLPTKKKAKKSRSSQDIVSLDQLFYLLTSIKDRPEDEDYIIRFFDGFATGIESRDHRILRDYMVFRRTALKDVFTIDPCDNLRYVGSNRIEIKRLYSLENQDNFGHTVSEYFEATRLQKKKDEHKSGEFINKWIREFGIGQRFSIESLTDGIGLVLKIYQGEDDPDGRLLADYGYGVSQLVSILLEIETAVLKVDKELGSSIVDYQSQTINLSNLWLVRDLATIPITIAIEEPEIHLHPRYQSLLADMFVDAYLNYGIHFIVETHSEYLIRKLQNHVGNGTVKTDALSFLYVEDGNDSDEKVREIGIAEDGRLTSSFGPGFFDEADSLAMNLLKIKGGLL